MLTQGLSPAPALQNFSLFTFLLTCILASGSQLLRTEWSCAVSHWSTWGSSQENPFCYSLECMCQCKCVCMNQVCMHIYTYTLTLDIIIYPTFLKYPSTAKLSNQLTEAQYLEVCPNIHCVTPQMLANTTAGPDQSPKPEALLRSFIWAMKKTQTTII